MGLFYGLMFIAGIALPAAGLAVFVGGVILLFRISSISVPGGLLDNTSARTGEYEGRTDPEGSIYSTVHKA